MGTYILAGASSKMALETAAQLKKEGHKVIGISTKKGISIYDEFYTVLSYNFSLFPSISEPVNGLVYFPGTINLKPFNRLNQADFMHDYQVNSLGAVAFVQAYLNNLKLSASGSVVFLSTVAVAVGMPYHASIAMAKGAIEALARSLAAEFAPTIRVNCVAPSLTNTPLSEKFINTQEKIEASEKRNPLNMVGEPKNIADAVVFLLSEKASWVTGQTWAVDGGMNNLKLL